MRKTVLFVTVAMLGALIVAGCSHRAKPTPASQTSTAVPEQPQTAGADSSRAGAGEGAGAAGGAGGMNAAQLSNRLVYFDFDSSDIKSEYTAIVAVHARNLAANASIKVRLEGHTDERGSREYNIGLGERRAQSVKRALMLQGVSESQITTVSYGEERPAVTGHTEEAWARNRRVEIVYVN
jgi:peptidoglycan-associated lipoprotein